MPKSFNSILCEGGDLMRHLAKFVAHFILLKFLFTKDMLKMMFMSE